MNYLICALGKVAGYDFFWASMGMTVSIGILIGAIVYNHSVREMTKGLVTIGCYFAMIALVTASRINQGNFSTASEMIKTQAYYGLATIMWVTLNYLIGVFVGVFILCIRTKRKGLSCN
jgi:hypothetical protein